MTPLLWSAAAGAALLLLALALLRTALSVIVVSGPSMAPALRPGQRVLVLRRGFARLRTGRIVVVAPTDLPPGGPAGRRPERLLVKRLAARAGEPVPEPVRAAVPAGQVPGGHVVLLGDNPAFSTDSRTWGAVPARNVVGVVLDRVRLGPGG
ncbi:S26 family signal peptidase [Kitasatospora sp. NPDC054939]